MKIMFKRSQSAQEKMERIRLSISIFPRYSYILETLREHTEPSDSKAVLQSLRDY